MNTEATFIMNDESDLRLGDGIRRNVLDLNDHN